jgi:hypothetical protein
MNWRKEELTIGLKDEFLFTWSLAWKVRLKGQFLSCPLEFRLENSGEQHTRDAATESWAIFPVAQVRKKANGEGRKSGEGMNWRTS